MLRPYAPPRKLGTAMHRLRLAGLFVLFAIVAPSGAADAQGVDRVAARLLRDVMPEADRFDPVEGNPPVKRAYRGDELIGYVFLTSDLPPEEIGYSGPVRAVVGVTPDGYLTGVRVTEYFESYMRAEGRLPENARLSGAVRWQVHRRGVPRLRGRRRHLARDHQRSGASRGVRDTGAPRGSRTWRRRRAPHAGGAGRAGQRHGFAVVRNGRARRCDRGWLCPRVNYIELGIFYASPERGALATSHRKEV